MAQPPLPSEKSPKSDNPSYVLPSFFAFLIACALLVRNPTNNRRESDYPEETSEPERENSQSPLGRELIIHPPTNTQERSEEKKRKTPIWEKVTVFIALGLLIVNICQMRATQKAADAAASAAHTAQDALVVSNRPWLGADHLIFTDPVRIVNIGGAPDLYMLQAVMAYKYEIRNYGKDPALRVHYHAQAIEFRLGTDAVDATQDMSCKMADGEFFKDIGNGAAIFPNDFLDATNDNAPGILIPPRKIFGDKVPDTANGKFFVAGCTTYVDQFFDVTKKVHHTRFCFVSDTPLHQVGKGAELRRCRREIRAD